MSTIIVGVGITGAGIMVGATVLITGAGIMAGVTAGTIGAGITVGHSVTTITGVQVGTIGATMLVLVGVHLITEIMPITEIELLIMPREEETMFLVTEEAINSIQLGMMYQEEIPIHRTQLPETLLDDTIQQIVCVLQHDPLDLLLE